MGIKEEFDRDLNDQMWVGANKDNPEYEVALWATQWMGKKCADSFHPQAPYRCGSKIKEIILNLTKELGNR